jgi:hypothetical protein
MKFIKNFDTQQQFNNFVLDENNTPNTSLIEELVGTSTSAILFTPQIIPHNYANDYFTLVAIDNCAFIFTCSDGELSYSLNNGNTWSEYISSTENLDDEHYIYVAAGNKILFKGHNFSCSGHSCGEESTFDIYEGNNSPFALEPSNQRFNVEGNIMSLLYGDNFIGQSELIDLSGSQDGKMFNYLFESSTTLISAKNLILPATTLAEYCYCDMFCGCSSLIEAPQLPATQLAEYCYYQMFASCSSLTTAPDLLATTLESNCYVEMFSGCTNLEYVKCLGYYYDDGSTSDWLNDVSATGTFVKDQYTDWDTGSSGIPEGWTVQNA